MGVRHVALHWMGDGGTRRKWQAHRTGKRIYHSSVGLGVLGEKGFVYAFQGNALILSSARISGNMMNGAVLPSI